MSSKHDLLNAASQPLGDDALLTDNETADELRCTPTTLGSWRAAGKGPAWVKFGSRGIRYRVGDVRTYIREQTVRPVGREQR